ncbi:MAG TPA: hypothetical protein VHW00_16975 [Thermoanaerobaculia bacterium]|nr:hypothetical protein [Thermoanaerobaculia bacterium]
MSSAADWTRRILIGALVLVAGSQVYLAQQNRALKQRVVSQSAAVAAVADAHKPPDRSAYEASMQGQCQPFFETAAPKNGKRYDVSIYFSLERDCMSCVTDVVRQWNSMTGQAAIDVHGYTRVDGTRARAVLEQELRPLFPVTEIDDLEVKLKAMGVQYTPVVFVSDAATGRILFTHAPLPSQLGDRRVLEKLQTLIQPCA